MERRGCARLETGRLLRGVDQGGAGAAEDGLLREVMSGRLNDLNIVELRVEGLVVSDRAVSGRENASLDVRLDDLLGCTSGTAEADRTEKP